MPPDIGVNIVCCYFMECQNAHKVGYKAPLKCGNCGTARYCSKECQRAHWKIHKAFCKNWAETAKQNNATSLIDVKKKMTRFLWLIRGLPSYSRTLFDEYTLAKQNGFKGCMEFFFSTFQELYEAIDFIEALPVVEERMYYPMPYNATYQKGPDGMPVGTKVKMRLIFEEHRKEFVEKVVDKRFFTESDTRENLPKLLSYVGDSEDIFVLSCSVKLEGTYATYSYEFIYREFDGYETLRLKGGGDAQV